MNLVINESQPLWEYLRCAEKPVVLYGMGDGALKIPVSYTHLTLPTIA